MRRILAVISLLALVSSACSRGVEGRRPNVLLITLDTVRADRLGCYGWQAASTPELDRIASEGALFENVWTPVPFTMPAHTTMLSGVYPSGHGLHVNYTGIVSDQVRLLPEILQQEGYRTGAFVAARVLHSDFGLGRGFEHFSNVPEGGQTELEQVQRPGDQVTDEALAWIAEEDPRPFFAWVHLFDAHEPHVAPPGFEQSGRDAYDSEITFLDSQVGRLLAALEAGGDDAETLLLVTADHGEGLGEHGEPSHGLFVYASTLHVPLLMRWPSRIPAGGRPKQLAGLVDLLPTILAQLDLASPPGVEGRDLGPLLHAQELPAQPLYFESEYAARTLRWAPLRGLISYPWKLIEAPQPELFDLSGDPGELENLAQAEPERVERMRTALGKLRASMSRHDATLILQDEKLDKELKNLGYLGGAETPGLDEVPLQQLRDPKAGLEIFLDLRRADSLRETGEGESQLPALLALAESLVERSPESPSLWSLLAEARTQAKAWPQVEQALRRCLELKPDVPWRISALADAVREQGRTDEALALYLRALELEPSLGQTHSRIGMIQAQRGELPLAIESFRRFCELEPSSSNAHTNLANALLAAGQVDQGILSLERALVCDPDCLPALRTLSEALRFRGRQAQAVEMLRRGLELAPEDPTLLSSLAWMLSTSATSSLRRPEEALQLARRACARQPGSAQHLDVLAAAQAAGGNTQAAILSAQEALSLATGPQAGLQPRIQAHLALYRQGKPVVE